MLVLKLYNSPFAAGLVIFLSLIPSMIFYMPAGALIDQLNPRLTMLASEALRGVAIFSLFVAILRERPSLAFLISVMVAEEIFEIFSTLADRRYISRLVERENTAACQASIEVRSHAVVLAGRPIGPFLFSLGWYIPFLADALSFVASIVSLLLAKKADKEIESAEFPMLPRLWDDIREGIGWLLRDRRAKFSMGLMAVTSLVAQALILLVLAQAHADSWPSPAIGFVLAASGAGGAAGALIFRILPSLIKAHWLPVQMITWSMALAMLTITGGLSYVYCSFAMFLLGFTGAIGNIEFGTYLVGAVPNGMIAKVTGCGQMIAIGACGVGPVVGGAMIESLGEQGTVLILAAIMLLATFISFLAPGAAVRIARHASSAVMREGRMRCPIDRLQSESVSREPNEFGWHEVIPGESASDVEHKIVDYDRPFI